MRKNVYVVVMDSAGEAIEEMGIRKDIQEETVKICKNAFSLDSIAFGQNHILFFSLWKKEKTCVLNILSGDYEEYPTYEYMPSKVLNEKFYYRYFEEDNLNAYKFTALLLKMYNSENVEERKKYMYALNSILGKEVFQIDTYSFEQNTIILKGRDLMECAECIDADESQQEGKEIKFFPDSIYSYQKLKETIDEYFYSEFNCECIHPISVSEEENRKYYGLMQTVVKRGGKAHFGYYNGISLELDNYGHIYKITYKVTMPATCQRVYTKCIEEMERNVRSALAIAGENIDIDYEKAENESKKAIDFWISKVKRVAETMKVVIYCENDIMTWEEAFCCKNPTVDKLTRRIKEVHERFEGVIMCGINADFDVFSDDYQDILETYKGSVLSDKV